MNTFKNTLFAVFFGICFISCTITNQVRVLHLEVLKPGLFELPKNIRTVAIFNRDLYRSDTCILRYMSYGQVTTDTNLRIRDLGNSCVDQLASHLEKQNYFQEITNFRDSLTYPSVAVDDIYKADDFFEKSGADACIFLNYFNLHTHLLYSSKYLVPLRANLWWSIVFKDDSSPFLYNQFESVPFEAYCTLICNLSLNPETALRGISGELGKSMATKLIPCWQPVERIYYRSKNEQMLEAEKFAMEDRWHEAAETWNPMTRNKNAELAGKACFNMALACEMLDKHSLAIEWLCKSREMKITRNETHVQDCETYLRVLKERLNDIENLKKQTGDSGQRETTTP